jgi:hypothetical protein
VAAWLARAAAWKRHLQEIATAWEGFTPVRAEQSDGKRTNAKRDA